MKRILLLVFSIHALLFCGAQNCESRRYQDTIFHSVTRTDGIYFGTAVPYGLLAQPQDLYFDFYEPTGDTLRRRPLIVFQFGGGFTIGWRSEPDIPAFCTYFAKCGYAVASIDYRIGLNPLDTNSTVRAYYRGVQDERAALRFLCQRAGQFRFDTSAIILTGTSAGCFCAFANAFTTNTNRPPSSFGSTLEPDDLGCYDCSGNADFGLHIPRIKAIVNQWGAIMDTSFIDAGENVPVISFHGDQDVLVPYVYGYPFQLPVFPKVYGSVPIHERLTNLGIPNVLHPLVGYGHEPELLAPWLNDTIYNYTRPFLFDVLRPHTSPVTGDTVICANTIAHYSVTNTQGSKYCWDVSAGGTIVFNGGNTIAVIWTDTGLAQVRVKELNYIMAEGESQAFSTHVVAHATSSFAFATNELAVSFTNLSQASVTYNWNFGDGTFAADSAPATKNYLTGGSYTVSLIASNNYCADTFSQSFLIDSCPVADVTYQLNGPNGFFYTPYTNTQSYYWNFGDGDSALVSSPNVFHQYQYAGSYLVQVKVTNQLGCAAIDTITVIVELPNSIKGVNMDEFVWCDNAQGCFIQAAGHATLEVFDAMGRKVTSEKINGNYHLSTADYAPGVYLLRLYLGNNVVVKKLVKN